MLDYQLIAKTIKTIDNFDYSLYRSISYNMLKYNNDSSTTLRVLSSLIDGIKGIKEDIVYKPKFNLNLLDFITIDRFNAFRLNKINNINIIEDRNIIYINNIKGYSKYSNKEYDLEYIENNKDFVRHSLPKDMFLGENIFSDGYELISLTPNMKENIYKKIKNSKITIRPYSGFNPSSILNGKSVFIKIEGIDICGREISEVIEVKSNIDYISSYEYSYIKSIIQSNSIATLTIVLFPYENGEFIKWDKTIVDREELDEYDCLLSVDTERKGLLFSLITENSDTFPYIADDFKIVKFNIPQDKEIWASYIDKPNRLVYLILSDKKLYCFPLIIPTTYNNTLDSLKTRYQSIKIEYTEDSINEVYNFYLFPSHVANDIESLSIFINGEEYITNILLDSIRYNIDTNKIVIPFSSLFYNTTNCIIEFRTYGTEEGISPIYIDNSPLEPLYISDLANISTFNNNTPQLNSVNFSTYYKTNNRIGYKEYISGDLLIDENCTLIKLSNNSNVLLNGYKIINIFNTFTFDEPERVVITSDTITHLIGE